MPADHHLLVAAQPVADDANRHAAGRAAPARASSVSPVAEHIEHAAGLVVRHRRVGHQQRLVRARWRSAGRGRRCRARRCRADCRSGRAGGWCRCRHRPRCRRRRRGPGAGSRPRPTRGKLHRVLEVARGGPVAALRQPRVASAAAWSMSKLKSIGSMVTMVASSVAVLASPPETRLPGLTRCRPMRPVSGARTVVNSRSSLARCSAASACGRPAPGNSPAPAPAAPDWLPSPRGTAAGSSRGHIPAAPA